jgi:hypothetical protein
MPPLRPRSRDRLGYLRRAAGIGSLPADRSLLNRLRLRFFGADLVLLVADQDDEAEGDAHLVALAVGHLGRLARPEPGQLPQVNDFPLGAGEVRPAAHDRVADVLDRDDPGGRRCTPP